MRPRATWQWTLIGGLIGFFVIHPCVMVTAHLMLKSGLESNYSIADIILVEFAQIFSVQMLPWGLSFAIISALSGLFLGRTRQMTHALQENEQRFRKLSITDDLTGIYNSRHFFNRLKNEIERTNRYGHSLTLLILDLDNFKQYNDTFGHLAGDSVLAETGKIIRKSIRSTDTAYRYGGEEFAILLPESGGQESLNFAERIRMEFESNVFPINQEKNLRVTVSIGVAQYISGEKITAFIKRADENMYVAKSEGKNRTFFSQ